MADVKFKRIENSSSINEIPISDGNFIVTKDGKSYIDYDSDRIPTNGTPDTQMSDISRNTVENKVIKEYIDNQINISKTETAPKLLWRNSDPYTPFSEQIITLNDDDYNMLEFFATSWYMNGYRKLVSVRLPKGISGIITTQFVTPANSFYIASRIIDYRDVTHFTIANSRAVDSGNISNVLTNNEVLIPYCVVGYKTGLFG